MVKVFGISLKRSRRSLRVLTAEDWSPLWLNLNLEESGGSCQWSVSRHRSPCLCARLPLWSWKFDSVFQSWTKQTNLDWNFFFGSLYLCYLFQEAASSSPAVPKSLLRYLCETQPPPPYCEEKYDETTKQYIHINTNVPTHFLKVSNFHAR